MSNGSAITKILIFVADPSDAARLRLGREVREIKARLRQSTQRDRYKVDDNQATRPSDLRQQMLQESPAIVHFSGHGGGANGLVFEDDQDRSHLVSTEALADLFRLFKDQVQCVILNSCYSEVQAKAISEFIPYVIGMKQEIGDEAAINFSVGFYDALFEGKSVEVAFQFGCNSIQLESLPDSVTDSRSDRALVPAAGVAVQKLPEHLKPVLIRRDTSEPEVGAGQHAALVFDPSSDKHVQRGNVIRQVVGGDKECDEYKYALGVVNLSSKLSK